MTHPEDGGRSGATAASAHGADAAVPASGATALGGRRRHRRLSAAVLAASVLVGVALLLWAADWGARYGAQSLLARTIQTATGVPTRPEVHLNGTFFLPQVVSGRYDDVEITIRDLSAGPLRVQSVHARLSGVHLPFHDVLARNIGPVLVDHSQEDAVLTYADLNRYLDTTGRSVHIGPAPGGQAKLTGTVRVLGHDVSASARAKLSTRGGALLVSPTQLDTDTSLDSASKLLLGQRLSFAVPLDPLPFGQELTDVEPQGSDVLVTARGQGVVVRP